VNKASRKHYGETKEKSLARCKRYRDENPKKRKALDSRPSKVARNKEYAKENREKRAEQLREWRRNNPEKQAIISRRADARKRSTAKGRLDLNISSGIRRSLLNGSKGGQSAFDLLGYSLEQIMAHLEKQFQPGMTWENNGRGKTCWHIDHIIPVSVHNYSTPHDIDFKKCWALNNLRPLWEPENRRGTRRPRSMKRISASGSPISFSENARDVSR
jgi:hypothetical protein